MMFQLLETIANAFHAFGTELGATDNGAPGQRRAGDYAAYLLDRDGNNLEAGAQG